MGDGYIVDEGAESLMNRPTRATVQLSLSGTVAMTFASHSPLEPFRESQLLPPPRHHVYIRLEAVLRLMPRQTPGFSRRRPNQRR